MSTYICTKQDVLQGRTHIDEAIKLKVAEMQPRLAPTDHVKIYYNVEAIHD